MKKVYAIYQLTGIEVMEADGIVSNLQLDEMFIGYAEGTERDAQNVCDKLKSNRKQAYAIPSDNEAIFYPQFYYVELPKLN